MNDLVLGWRIARRELRAGVRGLRIVLACLALGVAAIAAVGTLRAGVVTGMREDGRRILGGDLEVTTGQRPLPDAAQAWLEARGGRISRTAEMRAMLVAPSGDRMLVELKPVDAAWPLVGAAEYDPPQARIGDGGLVAEQVVLDRLGLHPGDTVRLGDASFTVRGALTLEPDKVASPAILGPRVLIAYADLPATGLVQPGSLMQFNARIALPPDSDVAATVAAARQQFRGEGWRIRDSSNAAPGVVRFVEQTALFMTLVGLTSLLVGGIGVANGVRAWILARARTIATLRCLGAPAGMVFAAGLIQIGLLSALGIAVGLVLGALLPFAAAAALADVLPVAPRTGLYPGPLAEAALFGLLTAAAFALWPLARARDIPGAALFRDVVEPAAARPRGWLLALNIALVTALVALTVATAQDRLFAAWFCAGALGTLLLYRLAAVGVMWLAARIRRPGTPALRLGLANLHRPGAATPLMLVSLGLGLSTLAAVALIQGNVSRTVNEQMPAQAPSFFFVDIQSAQAATFDSIVRDTPGVSEERRVPSLRARVVAVNGVPADQVQATPDTAWALRGDRGLTYAATPPEGTRIVAGSWWAADYRGPPLVSFDANLARGWGIGVGDTITVNVLGRDIPLRVASLRDIAWRSLGMNFTLVASPGLLEAAPHTHIATVTTTPETEAALMRRVTDALPNVSAIRVRDALEAINGLLGQIAAALTATGSVTLLAGALVLAGAVAAGQRRRIRDAVVLKTLGATRADIRRAFLVEFGALGLTVGVVAAAVGTAASWAVVTYVMRSEWAFLPGRLALTVIGCMLLTLAFGWAGTGFALRAKAAPLLRNE